MARLGPPGMAVASAAGAGAYGIASAKAGAAATAVANHGNACAVIAALMDSASGAIVLASAAIAAAQTTNDSGALTAAAVSLDAAAAMLDGVIAGLACVCPELAPTAIAWSASAKSLAVNARNIASSIGKKLGGGDAAKTSVQKAAEQTAIDMAKQIERDLGKKARRMFHDADHIVDRSLDELKLDAAELYEAAGKQMPKWMSP